MNLRTTTHPLPDLDADLDADLVALVLPAEADAPDAPAGLRRFADDAKATGEPVLFYDGDRRWAVLRLKDEKDEPEALRTATARLAATAAKLKVASVALSLPEPASAEQAAALVEGFVLGGYRFRDYKTGDDDAADVETLVVRTEHEVAAEAARIHAESACFARDLVNLSPHDKTPELLAERLRRMAEDTGLRAEIWGKARIEQERMGGLLAVNRGSQDPPAFIVLEHEPENAANERPIVLVGKAVVFDTGGLSLKPTKGSMDQMKVDMAGGAAVAGAVRAAALLNLPLHVVALIPATDNRPGERAYVPGEVVTMRSGATVEVLNTDAEGRMILADALDVAKAYEPELVVSVATLTGAQVIALGGRVGAVLTAEDDESETRLRAFAAAGDRTGEWVAPLPMRAHYAEQIESDVADLKNVGGREAGTVTAAKFLEHFTRNGDAPAYPWVHLDIAGPALAEGPQPYRPKGGTGFGVRLLVDLLQDRAPS